MFRRWEQPLSQWLLRPYRFNTALRERGNLFSKCLSLSQVSIEKAVLAIKSKIVLFINTLGSEIEK